ncbi:hypothetical protein [Motiliproteus sediminis]|uniref:hypothetical protein n=1 Tax=Motiliproteus sediminis TaxID=1468178 RepID=UPI001AEFE43A|nr:hypothetical protein [Motiliproteus sediminis]
MNLIPESPQQWLMLLFAAASFITLGWQYLRSRRLQMPPSARNDIKARRLWRGDRRAYQRKYGDIDKQLEERSRNGD